MAIKKYSGSCHCGKVKYTAEIDFTKGTSKCNCTFCTKVRSWGVFIKADAFELLSGKDNLTGYRGKNQTTESFFCKTCGVYTHKSGNAPWMGGAFVGIHIASLDDVSGDELAAAPIIYADGRNDDWMKQPEDIRNL